MPRIRPLDNSDMVRREEPTKAPTPDKLDRAIRNDANKSSGDEMKPYPLTEEEATPNTPDSEASFKRKQSGNKNNNKKKVSTGDKSSKIVEHSKKKKKSQSDKTVSDYNKFVSHPRKR